MLYLDSAIIDLVYFTFYIFIIFFVLIIVLNSIKKFLNSIFKKNERFK